MIYIRSTVFNILFYTTLALSCILTCILGIFNRKLTTRMWTYVSIPFYKFLLRAVCGLKIEFRGKEHIHSTGAIYASKHQSAIETYVMSGYIKNAVFILKKELTYIPIFGWAQALYGMISVDRGSHGAAMKKMLRDAKDRVVNKNRPLIIFPEGTRTKPGTDTVYKPGIYGIVQSLKTPVVPVALNSGLFWAKHSFLRYPGTIVIEFLPPISGELGKQEFMDELKSRIEAKCAELNEEAAAKYPHARKVLNKNKGLS